MKIIGPMSGIGARLRPFTFNKPKGLLKVAGKRVIDHILELFKEITHINTGLEIVTSPQNRSVREYLKERYSDHFDIHFTIQNPKGYVGDIPYFGGLGEAIYITEGWYSENISSYNSKDPEDYAVIFLSDMIPLDGFGIIYDRLCGKVINTELKDNLPDEFKDNKIVNINKGTDEESGTGGGVNKKGEGDDDDNARQNRAENGQKTGGLLNNEDIDGVLGVMWVPRSRASSYGIIELDANTGKIKRLVEKPKEFISNLAIAGVYAFKPRAMKKIYEHLKEEVEAHKDKEGEAQFTPALQGLIEDGFNLVTQEFYKGILDFGKPDTLLEGNKYLLKSNDNVEGGPVNKIINSSLIKPSFIGKNVVINNCIIGPYCSVGDNTVLESCILSNCVIGDECSLERIITKNSIIGDFVVMDDMIKDNLIIGDMSSIKSSKSAGASKGKEKK